MAKSKLLTDTQFAVLKPKELEYRVSDIMGLYLKVVVTGKNHGSCGLRIHLVNGHSLGLIQ
ncbi:MULTISPECIES: Arm DNA-binding domain-containing protein [Acinetobacter]|mgnify:FL=1|uniref:Uncharacterized protein n=1 Tax=Acinetobacter pseudolwoffii TaxID=2053287 RepID=A0A2H9ULC0_9GAMM|nr:MULTISPECIES: Arm DNA-binding domain-containing protein [Acinetobacter]MCP0910133.1 Arm DNA-binding domain-containing protein [Acinetobacter pseudolwoffii]MDH5819425.1 Arm DNA-binding domain-containing protein [Acinetobacter pseudolwoffii]MDM1325452.1 DUF4102 domain-containing protein [Acinetobacter pseudolwoffii]MDM1337132.1 DUF4102 domain-containing protein [Acinetobacter pseudolwoffii]MDM1340434.1 DUF4102 domain-containing protein [Acinetobacter pseudolwoffii]